MNAWRILKLRAEDAFKNMAIDEAILRARIEEAVPNTIRFYQWNPSAVSIGRFQDVFQEVHVENCKKHGVDVVRRISGGGTVYHDCDGEITYSVVVSEKNLGSEDVVAAYHQICSGLVEAAKTLGVRADFNLGDPKRCPNITISGRKISGSAQSRKRGALLQHGSFLLDMDLKKMFTFLKVPWAQTLTDVLNIAQKRLTSIKHELRSTISTDEACQALIIGFQRALNIQLVEGELTSYEQSLAEILRKQKFATDDWNFKGRSR
ncbi:MAG: lipoate--protein ligase family protein [Candidatus Bathyarchaeota archaeon]|nr:lipoate--protein ligase family protein [Candidatus Bathyarchaeota archaeon]MDH5713160.1 lipoate--protein ligase family protein [Candidatus Bathyarchaeota archaeon]